MGTWSHGNFDNDTALDWLSDITSQLLDEITEAMDSPECLEADELDADVVPCKIELLCTMAENGMSPIWPDVHLLEEWKSTFLRVWDESIDSLEPDEDYKRDRRQTLVNTYDRMIALARDDQEEGDASDDEDEGQG